jgi:hypothetical protein
VGAEATRESFQSSAYTKHRYFQLWNLCGCVCCVWEEEAEDGGVNECAKLFLMTGCECVVAADPAMKLKFGLPMSTYTATDCRNLPPPETRSSPNTTLLPSIAETTGASSTSTGIRLYAVLQSLSIPLPHCGHKPDTQSFFFPRDWKPY